MIYLDNSATSFPKPKEVVEAIVSFLTEIGANPGRSGHRLSVAAARVVYEAREKVSGLFNCPDPLSVVFGANATYGLNLAIKGLLKPGDHVITTSMEHNSVLRPLRTLEKNIISLSVIAGDSAGKIDPGDIGRAITDKTRLIVMNAASNVTGTILPIKETGEIARKAGILFLVDAAQAGGILPIDMEKDCIDLLAFTGHKALYGPTGTGGLIFGNRADIKSISPLMEGGTGSRSQEELQPAFLPDKYESGTLNAAGLAGLSAGISWVMERGLKKILAEEQLLASRLREGIRRLPKARIYGPEKTEEGLGIVSFTLADLSVSEIGGKLDREYGIMTRVGLHCAPAAHRTIGTFPTGTVRLSLGAFNTEGEVTLLLSALEEISKQAIK